MHVVTTKPLFAWDALEDSPSLKTIRQFLRAIPDADLLHSLRQARGRGRNDCPVHVAWGVVLLTAALRHPSTEATLSELRRNPALRELIGIESEGRVPRKWNISRFLSTLGREPHLSLLRGIFDQIVRTLGEMVPDLGVDTAGDASHLSARRSRSKSPAVRSVEKGLPQASGGRKEYHDESGKVVRVHEWFGFKFHVLVDRTHEVPLAYRISSTKTGDNQVLGSLVRQARGNLPEGRIKSLAYDKAADDRQVHKLLHRHDITPLIEIRSLWTDQHEQMLPGHDGRSNIVYDEAGTVYCYNKVSDPPVRQRMAYIGHESSRGTLKYRCPARHQSWRCPSHRRCNGDKKYGLTVRVNRQIDLRRFPPIPRATKKFERLYKGRTAVERVIARTKIFWGADDGNVTGSGRFHGLLGAVMVTHAAFALLLAAAPRRGGTLGQTRLTPIAEALGARWPT